MIEVFRLAECAFSDEVVEQLQELVLAHRVQVVQQHGREKQFPVVKEGKHTYTTRSEIQLLLKQLGREMIVQREMQSDSCKIDPDTGESC